MGGGQHTDPHRFGKGEVVIEEAREQIRRGMALDEDEFDAWLDTLTSDEDDLVPQPHGNKVQVGA